MLFLKRKLLSLFLKTDTKELFIMLDGEIFQSFFQRDTGTHWQVQIPQQDSCQDT